MNSSMIDSNAPQVVRVAWEMVTTRDDTAGSPTDQDEGFWPSVDPDSVGYIGRHDGELQAKFRARWRKARDAAQKRYEDWSHDKWEYVGVIARARLFIPVGSNSFATYTIDSPGLWGIESDSGDYLRSVFEEQKNELRDQLSALGRAFAGLDILAEQDSK